MLKNIFFLPQLFIWLFMPVSVFAISVDKSTYALNDEAIVTCSDPSNGFQVYLLTTEESFDTYSCSEDFRPAFAEPGSFSVVELKGINICDGEEYDDCKSHDYFVGEALFTFSFSPAGGASPEQDMSEETFSSGTISYRPEVTILSPKLGAIFSRDGIIEYAVTDKNNNGSAFEKRELGLTENPVSIFYSDKIDEWDHSIVADGLKKLIVKGLPATGFYVWKIADLVPGVFYRIIVDAVDALGYIGEEVSDFFTVDFSAPVFTVNVNPPMVRGGEVTISIDSSKVLSLPPKVNVTQKDGKSIEVEMKGENSHYEGVYTVIAGFDGTAKVSVSGKDIAGNIGGTIVGGGTFSVGVDAPPKPIITSHSISSISTEEFIKISGTTRDDTMVSVVVNGTDKFETKPDSKGVFTFDRIKLEKIKNYGLNFLSFSTKDANGTPSESNTIKIKFNLAPTISILSPAESEVLGGQITIVSNASDGNNDPLFFTYEIIPLNEYSKASGASEWITVGENLPNSRFVWNTTEVDDGQYILRAFVSDSTTISTSTLTRLSVKNTLPFIRFEDGRKTITNKATTTIFGRALTPENLSPRPNIASVEYSIDNGKKWKKVNLTTPSSGEQKFEVTFSDLTEGVYPIIWRVKDGRGLLSRTTHSIVVDTTHPTIPEINFPRKDSVVNNDSDENNKKDGTQISITGVAEPGSTVTLSVDGKVTVIKGRPDGVINVRDVDIIGLGHHEIKVFATDSAGNKSPEKIISFVHNNPPVITFVHPRAFRGISGVETGKENIIWKIEDKDNDKIKDVVLSYRKGSSPFKILSRDNLENKFLWDISGLGEGNDYELKIDATDGTTAVSAKESFSIDRTPPSLISFSFKDNVLGKGDSLVIEGLAEDVLSGIEFIEYSMVADGTNISQEIASDARDWFKGLITSGYLRNKASFTIKHSLAILDGKYEVFARSVDTAGNVSKEVSQEFLVDILPPRVGSFMAKNNDISISPDQLGALSVYKDRPFTFAISLEADTFSAFVTLDKARFDLKKDVASGLWQMVATSSGQSDVDILVSAEDIVHNVLKDKNIGVLRLLKPGRVTHLLDGAQVPLSDVSIRVLQLNDSTQEFTELQVGGDGTDIKTDSSGNYSLALPAGTYKVIAEKVGFKVVSKEITISKPEFVSMDFITTKYSGITGFFNSIMDWIRY